MLKTRMSKKSDHPKTIMEICIRQVRVRTCAQTAAYSVTDKRIREKLEREGERERERVCEIGREQELKGSYLFFIYLDFSLRSA